MDYKISLCASAIRTECWQEVFESIKGNKYPIEIIFVGDNKPDFDLPPFVQYIYATVKPSQCYQIAFLRARGELIGWTADDGIYNYQNQNNLDILYNFYKSFNRKDVVVGLRPIEDNRDVFKNHYFFGKHPETPYMLPFGFIDKEYFLELGGYDKNFICGQAENDVVMRIYEKGGIGELCMNAFIWVDHVHKHDWKHANEIGFRHTYPEDRVALENAWVKEGYGYFKKTGKIGNISKTRLLPVESYEDREDICSISQGKKGSWK